VSNPGTHLDHDWFPEPLPPNVSLDEKSWCYSSYSCLHFKSRHPKGVTVGANSGIYHGSFFDLGPDGEVIIGDYCTLVGAIIASNEKIVIGNYCFIAHEVVLADSFAATPSPTSSSPAPKSPGIVLGENCWIGARSVLLSGARIGEGSIVGAGAVVDFEVPPFSTAAGNPARIVSSEGKHAAINVSKEKVV